MYKKITLIAIMAFSINAFAQITFQKSFGPGTTGKPSVKQTSDGGYIIAGDNLVRTNNNGDTLWTKSFYFGVSNGAQQTFDGGYAIAGYTYSFGAGSTDYYLTRTDTSGNILWSKTYGGTSYEEAYAMQQTADSGFILAGNTYGLGFGGWDFYLVRTDKNGDTLWTRAIGGSGEDKAEAIYQTLDGGFIVAGYTTSFGSSGPDAYVVKTDASGNVTWSKTYNGPGGEFISCIRQTLDGGYIFTGRAVNFTTTGRDLFLIKTDINGVPAWSHFFTNLYNTGNAVVQTSDGGYIITGSTSVSTANGNDVCLIKTDLNGDTVWTKKYGSTGGDIGTSVQETSDGGYIVAGTTTSFGNGYYLLKTDNLGNSGCNQDHTLMIMNNTLVTYQSVASGVFSGSTVIPFTVTAGSGLPVTSICFNTTGIHELTDDHSFLIYPNPSTGNFTISTGSEIQKGMVHVFTVLGEKIFEGEMRNSSNKEIRLLDIAPGIYFVKITDGDKQYSQKLIIKNN